MTRVLVTGGSGFIGYHVLEALTDRFADVHACSRKSRPWIPGVTWHRTDVLDPVLFDQLVQKVRPEVLLLLAWFATPPDYWKSPLNLQWAAASLLMVDAFVRAGGQRIVGVGTCAEYAWSDSPCVEGVTPIRPASVYGGCKAAVWSAIEPFARDVGVTAAWARVFFVYGPDPSSSPTRLVPSLVNAMLDGEPARCRTAAHLRDFLYVSDVADALAALTLSGVRGAVNIGCGTATRVGAIAEGIADRLKHRELLQMEDGPAQDAHVVANVDRLRNEVGWQPRVTLDEGLNKAVMLQLAYRPAKVMRRD